MNCFNEDLIVTCKVKIAPIKIVNNLVTIHKIIMDMVIISYHFMNKHIITSKFI